jgi:succinate dehydrogenase/fumarate reductase flavoprotein subunit
MKPARIDLNRISDHDSYDVVVLGTGAAGASAALNARLNGSRVLWVERTEYVGGTSAWSAATAWVPCTEPGLKVNPHDSLEKAARFLDHAVGQRAPRDLRMAFLKHGPEAIRRLESDSELKFQVRALHPDYLSELPDAMLSGRAIEPCPFDGRLLGPNLSLLRPPIPEFTVLGGMMVDRDDIFHLLRLTQNLTSLRHSLRILVRHAMDRLTGSRGTRLVMGNALIARLLYSYLKVAGDLVTRTEAVALQHDSQGITGLTLRQVDANGSVTERQIQVKGGVILATGGFNRNPGRRALWLPGIEAGWSPAAPGHTGTALELALQAGAVLAEPGLTAAFWAPCSTRTRQDGSQAVFPHFVMDRGKPGMLTVDQSGRRFVNESTSYHLFGLAMQARHREVGAIPAWLIGDAAALRRHGMGMVRPGGKGLAPFLADGYLRQGRTLAELAQAIGVPASALEHTVTRFNGMAERGVDEDFQRGTTDYQRANGDASWHGPNPCLGPLTEGPFYAVALYPGDIGAATGLKTDAQSRVLDRHDQAIAGLYACGNDMSSIMGDTYPAPGITIGPGLVFGHLAAQQASARSKGQA